MKRSRCRYRIPCNELFEVGHTPPPTGSNARIGAEKSSFPAGMPHSGMRGFALCDLPHGGPGTLALHQNYSGPARTIPLMRTRILQAAACLLCPYEKDFRGS